MIETFIEKNRKMLALYYRVMRIGGWLLLSLASLAAARRILPMIEESRMLG